MYKLGRLPRAYSPHVPHLAMLRTEQNRITAPASIDYTKGLPSDLGVMLNNSLGCCTCAAVYHSLQIWTANANPPMDTEPDSNVLALYEQTCGYKPNDPSTDNGGVEQEVLSYILKTGAPVGDGSKRHKIAAFVEIDPKNIDDVRAAIYSCGLVYIGFNVPGFLMASGPPQTWDVSDSGDQSIVGGHAVIVAGYDEHGLILVSWGQVFRMSFAFWAKYVDEAYALADSDWIKATGHAPCGLTLTDLEAQMQALKDAA